MLADEPTGALDSVNGEGVMRLLRSACQRGRRDRGRTHDAQLAAWADSIVFCATAGWWTRPRGSPVPTPCSPRARIEDHRTTAPASAVPALGRVAPLARGRPLGVRMFRREWRQQALVLALLTAAVAASVGVASAASTTPVPDNAVFGSASHLISFRSTDPAALARDIAATLERFESAEVITHRSVALPGEFEPIDYRAQDPAGPFGGPRLDLVEGEYPTGDEVAVTDGAAELLEVEPGGSLPLDGVPRTVVGIVENPGDLSDEFVLVPPSGSADADQVTILLDASDDEVMSFRIPSGGDLETGSRLQHEGVIAAVGVLVLTTVGLLLVGLIAVAGFVVIAHRRMRQARRPRRDGATSASCAW